MPTCYIVTDRLTDPESAKVGQSHTGRGGLLNNHRDYYCDLDLGKTRNYYDYDLPVWRPTGNKLPMFSILAMLSNWRTGPSPVRFAFSSFLALRIRAFSKAFVIHIRIRNVVVVIVMVTVWKWSETKMNLEEAWKSEHLWKLLEMTMCEFTLVSCVVYECPSLQRS